MDMWSSAFVVSDVRSMTALIKAGKKLDIKSFAIIPLSEVGEVRPVSVGKSAGVIGPLSTVLKADKQYRGLLNFIAGDTVLVESEGIAYILASEGFKTVTPDGEIFELGGRAFAYGLRDALSKVLEALEDIENVGEVQGAVKALRAAIEKRKQQMSSLENDDKTLTKDRVKKIASVAALRAEAETVVRLSKRYRAMHRSINQDFEAPAQGGREAGEARGLPPAQEGRDDHRGDAPQGGRSRSKSRSGSTDTWRRSRGRGTTSTSSSTSSRPRYPRSTSPTPARRRTSSRWSSPTSSA